MRTLIIIPAYNEEESILHTIEDLKTYVPEVDYIVVNDCSTDHTRQLLIKKHVPFLDLPVNLGIGGGVQCGYRYARDQGYDIAVQFDGDGQHMAEYVQELILPIEQNQADLVVGSRFIMRKGFQSSALRRFGINFLSGLIYLLCRIRVQDVTSGMRAVNRKVIVEFAGEYAQDYPEPEAILQAAFHGDRILEIPVQMRKRQKGTSSINAFRSVYYMIKVSLSLLLQYAANRKKDFQ